MPRLIDADTLKHKWWCDTNGTKHAMLISIDEAPTIDAQPVVHAHWRYDHMDSDFAMVRCTACGALMHRASITVMEGTYCPYCGAKMDEKEKDDD